MLEAILLFERLSMLEELVVVVERVIIALDRRRLML